MHRWPLIGGCTSIRRMEGHTWFTLPHEINIDQSRLSESTQLQADRSGDRQQSGLEGRQRNLNAEAEIDVAEREAKEEIQRFGRTRGHYSEEKRSEGVYANDNKDYSNTVNREMCHLHEDCHLLSAKPSHTE